MTPDKYMARVFDVSLLALRGLQCSTVGLGVLAHLAVLSGCSPTVDQIQQVDSSLTLLPTGGTLTVTIVPTDETVCLTAGVRLFVDGASTPPSLNRGCGTEPYASAISEEQLATLSAGDTVEVRVTIGGEVLDLSLVDLVNDHGRENIVYDRILSSHGENRIASQHESGAYVIDESPAGLEVPWRVRTSALEGFLWDDAYGFRRRQQSIVRTNFPSQSEEEHIQTTSVQAFDEAYSVQIGQRLKTNSELHSADCDSFVPCTVDGKWHLLGYQGWVVPRD